ncbi:MAG: 4Fe-4S binding protein [Anaerolineae bacterium]
MQRLLGEIDELLGRESLPMPDEYAEVSSKECVRCLTCIRTCPHQAVELRSTEDVTAAYVVPEACWGCGMCVANCPVRAISLIEAEHLVKQEVV